MSSSHQRGLRSGGPAPLHRPTTQPNASRPSRVSSTGNGSRGPKSTTRGSENDVEFLSIGQHTTKTAVLNPKLSRRGPSPTNLVGNASDERRAATSNGRLSSSSQPVERGFSLNHSTGNRFQHETARGTSTGSTKAFTGAERQKSFAASWFGKRSTGDSSSGSVRVGDEKKANTTHTSTGPAIRGGREIVDVLAEGGVEFESLDISGLNDTVGSSAVDDGFGCDSQLLSLNRRQEGTPGSVEAPADESTTSDSTASSQNECSTGHAYRGSKRVIPAPLAPTTPSKEEQVGLPRGRSCQSREQNSAMAPIDVLLAQQPLDVRPSTVEAMSRERNQHRVDIDRSWRRVEQIERRLEEAMLKVSVLEDGRIILAEEADGRLQLTHSQQDAYVEILGLFHFGCKGVPQTSISTEAVKEEAVHHRPVKDSELLRALRAAEEKVTELQRLVPAGVLSTHQQQKDQYRYVPLSPTLKVIPPSVLSESNIGTSTSSSRVPSVSAPHVQGNAARVAFFARRGAPASTRGTERSKDKQVPTPPAVVSFTHSEGVSVVL